MFSLKNLHPWGAAIAAVLAAHASYAQAPSSPLPLDQDPIVVTVSGKPMPLSSVSSAVTVLSREDIQASHAANLAELLRSSPGLHLSQAGGVGSVASASMRGGDPNFILVLVDGVPVNDPNTGLGGAFDFSTMSLVNVDRIEIARGPLSTMFGSDAMTGAVNIITAREGGESFAEGSVGRFGTANLQLVHTGTTGKLRYAAGASYVRAGEQVESDGFSTTAVSFNLSVQLTAEQALHWSSRLSDADSSGFTANGGGPLYSILRDPENRRTRTAMGSLEYTREIKTWWMVRGQVDVFDSNQRLDIPTILDSVPPGPGTVPSFKGRSNLLRKRFAVSSRMDFGQNWSTTVTFGRSQEDGTNRGTLAGFIPASFNAERSTNYVAGELLYDGRGVAVNIGARGDFVDPFDSRFSPHAGLVWSAPDSTTRLRLNWGEAFRLPSFFALGNPLVGNPQLRPESSRSIDAGIDQSIPRLKTQLHLTFFDEHYKDLIDFSPQVFRLVNRSEAAGRGVEIDGEVAVQSGIAVRGHATFVDSSVTPSDEPLRDRPRWRGGAEIRWTPVEPFDVRFDTTWVGARADLQVPVPERTVGRRYSTSTLTGSYRRGHATLFVRIQNLFDRPYEEFVGFPNPGFWIVTGIKVSTR